MFFEMNISCQGNYTKHLCIKDQSDSSTNGFLSPTIIHISIHGAPWPHKHALIVGEGMEDTREIMG